MSRYLLFFLFLFGCGRDGDVPKAASLEEIANAPISLPAPTPKQPPQYPWDKGGMNAITKEYFRCNGSPMNPRKGDLEDCGGFQSHSLPLKNGEEFVYPVLLDILNYLQKETKCRVVITAGHRCPTHHFYARADGQTKYSKHMIGAEVAFYLQGMENEPWEVVKLVQEFYKGQASEFSKFDRYEKEDTDVSTPPWYNKEIYMKLYSSSEGRDFDNRHPYPYLTLQVRFDRQEGKKVVFNWDEASKNLRKSY